VPASCTDDYVFPSNRMNGPLRNGNLKQNVFRPQEKSELGIA